MREETDHEDDDGRKEPMSETKTDYAGIAHKHIAEMNEKRGLVAAELSEVEAELLGHRGVAFDFGALALDAILGDGEAAAELGRREARKDYLERRAEMCREAMRHAEEAIEGQRRTWLQGAQVAAMDLEDIPEVLERQREGVGTILPEPDPAGLMPFARANT